MEGIQNKLEVLKWCVEIKQRQRLFQIRSQADIERRARKSDRSRCNKTP